MTDVIELIAPFEVTLGPKPRIVCRQCRGRIGIRNIGRGIAFEPCQNSACTKKFIQTHNGEPLLPGDFDIPCNDMDHLGSQNPSPDMTNGEHFTWSYMLILEDL